MAASIETAKSPLAEWLHNNRTWLIAALILVVGGLFVKFMLTHLQTQEKESAWNVLMNVQLDSANNLSSIEDSLKDTAAEPWFYLAGVGQALEKEDFALAKVYLDRLRSSHKSEAIESLAALFNSPEGSLSETIQTRMEKFEQWKEQNKFLFQNPEPDGARVTFVTSEGEFTLGLYKEAGGEIAENFLNNCRKESYVNTKLSEVRLNNSFLLGNPSTRAEDPKAWVEEKEEDLRDCKKNNLHHFAGSVSNYRKPGEEKCSAAEFMVTVNKQFFLDGQQTIFGKIVSGMDVVEKLGKIEMDYKTGKGIPKTIVTILETKILENN